MRKGCPKTVLPFLAEPKLAEQPVYSICVKVSHKLSASANSL